MTIKTLAGKGVPNRRIAQQLNMSEGNVRYHLCRLRAGAGDGRSRQPYRAAVFADPIRFWLDQHRAEHGMNLAALHAWLVTEHDYPGSLRSIERYMAAHYPPPRKRARRRIETPPGAQSQVDWAVFPNMVVGGCRQPLQAFHMELSHSRYPAVVWAHRQDQLSWLSCHNHAFTRLGGIPAVVRVDNTKTAVSRGAGPWGEINSAYHRYAVTVRFHIDPCLPRSPSHKGKVERMIRTQRGSADPTCQAWADLAELQAWTDEHLLQLARQRRCPATGQSIWESWQAERKFLAPLPRLPEPFDQVVTRTVREDGLVCFEGRQYSVPFAWLGQAVEVRGSADKVQILGGLQVIAEHPRHTRQRLLIDPAHYEGPATERVLAPMPLGAMGRKLQELAAVPVQQRPLDLYAALAEVAR